MDKEARILTRAIDATKALGLRWTVLAQAKKGLDALVRLRFDGLDKRYGVEVRRALRPHLMGPILQRLEGKQGALLVADYVNPALADLLREHRVQFLDTAGNAFLAAPPLFVFIKGQRPVEPTPDTRKPQGRALRPTGLKVLFALLCKPELVDRPYREIAALAGVAHGAVGWVLPELQQHGYVAEVRGRRLWTDLARLLDRWVEAYAQTLRPRLLLGRYRTDRIDDTARLEAAKHGLLWGGEPAAARLTDHLRPGTLTLYGPKVEPRLLIELRLRADPEGNVDFRRRFWNFEDEAEPGVVPPLLVYADLLAIGDARCREAATMIRERYLVRLF